MLPIALLVALPTTALASDPVEAVDLDAAAAELANELADDKWTVSYKDGMRIENGDTKFRFGGRIQFDTGFHSSDSSYPNSDDDGVEFRRARLYVQGQHKNINYKAQYTFSGNAVGLNDVWIQYQDLYGAKVGHFKEPMGLEQLTSSKYITFVERSQATEALTPSRNSGVAFNGDASKNGTYSVGIFKNTGINGNGVEDGASNLTGRLTNAPINDPETGKVLHLGISAQLADRGMYQIRSRPEMHLIGRAIDSGAFMGDDATTLGLEGAWGNGPLNFQAEYLTQSVSTAGGDVDSYGYYAQASYFLTGEHRPYKGGVFQRVVPNNPYSRKAGTSGAHELALRYSMLSVDTGAEMEQSNITLGYNLYLSRNSRIMFNYVTSDYEDGLGLDTSIQGLLIRFAIDF